MANQQEQSEQTTAKKEASKKDAEAKKKFSLTGPNDDICVVALLLLVSAAGIIYDAYHSNRTLDYWVFGIWFYLGIASVSFVPVWRVLRKKITGADFDRAFADAKKLIEEATPISKLDDDAKKVIVLNFYRINGTLLFWKKEAAMYRAAHYYCLFWTIPSAVLIPILTQAVDKSTAAKVLVTVISTFTAMLLAFHRGFKIEENFRSFRHGESEFYDLFRRILDRPNALGTTKEDQLDAYLVEIETIRRFVRNAETNNMATLDEARQLLKDSDTKRAGDPVSRARGNDEQRGTSAEKR